MHAINSNTKITGKQRAAAVPPATDIIFDSVNDIESAALRIRLLMDTIIEKAGNINDVKGRSREAVNAIDCFAEIALGSVADLMAANETVLDALRTLRNQGGK